MDRFKDFENDLLDYHDFTKWFNEKKYDYTIKDGDGNTVAMEVLIAEYMKSDVLRYALIRFLRGCSLYEYDPYSDEFDKDKIRRTEKTADDLLDFIGEHCEIFKNAEYW